MEKKQGNSNLTMSHEDANIALDKQIVLGQNIINLHITGTNFEKTKNEYEHWREYNISLLKKMFDTNSEANKYSFVGVIAANPYATLNERIEKFKYYVDDEVQRLIGLKKKLELYDSIAPAKSENIMAKTKVDKIVDWGKNNWIIAIIIVLFMVVSALAAFKKDFRELFLTEKKIESKHSKKITGIVYKNAGQPLRGVTVIINGDPNKFGVSDELGTFVINNIESTGQIKEEKSLRYNCNGYAEATLNVSINFGDTQVVNVLPITLKKLIETPSNKGGAGTGSITQTNNGSGDIINGNKTTINNYVGKDTGRNKEKENQK